MLPDFHLNLMVFLREKQPNIATGRTITTAVGFLARNQGNGFITNSFGIDIESQSGSTDIIDDFLVTVAIDTVNAASQPDVNARLVSIRNDLHQLARKLKQINDGLRTYGLFT
mgnify:CR=1 FL=1